VLLEVDNAELTRRIAGRRSCPNCGHVYNIHSKPLLGMHGELHCLNCVQAPLLVQRPDDNEATVGRRLQVYEEQTRPLVDYYRAQGLLRVISAEGDVDDVTKLLVAALSAPEARPHPRPAAAAESVRRSRAAAKSSRSYIPKLKAVAGAGPAGGRAGKPGKAKGKTAAKAKPKRKAAKRSGAPAKTARVTKRAPRRAARRR
jgi:adenylate kinase